MSQHPGTTPEFAAPAAAGAIVDAAVLGKAVGAGAGLVLGAAAVVALAGWLPEGAFAHAALGAAAAVMACVAAVWLHGRFLDARRTAPFARDPRLMAGRVQSLLAAAFGVKLAVLVAGALLLRQAGVKFAELATFCVTFAAASLVCQLATAFYLSRALQGRSTPAGASRGTPSPRTSSPRTSSPRTSSPGHPPSGNP